MIEKRNIWLGYMNLDFTEADDVFHYIYPVSPSNFMIKVTAEGNILGKHKGFSFYTIGQRKGLGISSEEPLYVLAFDKDNNNIIVGENEALFNDIKEYTRYIFDKCQLVVFKVSGKQLKDEEIAKVMTEEKGE